MKKLKTLISIVCTFAFAFICVGMVNAATAPSSIQVKRSIVLNDIVGNKDHGFTIFTTNEGQYIYCMDVDKTALVTGQKASLSGDGDAGLLYILQNGYPNKAITGNDNVDMYITQGAVWWYLDESKLSTAWKNATTTDIYGAIPKIKALVEAARNAKDTQAKPSITLTTNGTKLSLTSDKKYYESNYMAAAVVGAKTYTVSVSGVNGAEIIDESGNVGATMNSSERFKVRIPATNVSNSTSLTVKVSATGALQKAKIYKPSDTSYQRVVGLFDENISVEKQVVLSANPNRSCEYTDGKYYGKSGNVVDKVTYEKECKHVCEYTNDTYYGKDGSTVDKATFDQECGQVVTVPNTSANIILWSVVVGTVAILAGGGVIFYTGHKRKKA